MGKIAFICSPYRGDVKRNKEYARALTWAAIINGFTPICPHLYITEALNDENPRERETGRRLALELLGACDVVIAGTAYGKSAGMIAELKEAKRQGKKIIEVDVCCASKRGKK